MGDKTINDRILSLLDILRFHISITLFTISWENAPTIVHSFARPILYEDNNFHCFLRIMYPSNVISTLVWRLLLSWSTSFFRKQVHLSTRTLLLSEVSVWSEERKRKNERVFAKEVSAQELQKVLYKHAAYFTVSHGEHKTINTILERKRERETRKTNVQNATGISYTFGTCTFHNKAEERRIIFSRNVVNSLELVV